MPQRDPSQRQRGPDEGYMSEPITKWQMEYGEWFMAKTRYVKITDFSRR